MKINKIVGLMFAHLLDHPVIQVLTNSGHSAAMAHRYFVDAHSFFQGIFDVFLWSENLNASLIMLPNCFFVAAGSLNSETHVEWSFASISIVLHTSVNVHW
jgi:hypothetical protein